MRPAAPPQSDPPPAALDAPGPAALPVAALRQRFREGKQAIVDRFAAARPTTAAAARLLRDLARHVDATLIGLWRQAGLPPQAALVAVGGYGRGELFPHSDIDVLLLMPERCRPAYDTALRSAIERFVTACWDIGLEVGSAVRNPEQCVEEARREQTVQTALLEARWLCGARGLFKRFHALQAAAMDPAAFLRAKTLEMHQRHTKYEDTPYALEPNCKESPGGLRDLQNIRVGGACRRPGAAAGASCRATA
jgi:[protein-PII] uridylyltransferase